MARFSYALPAAAAEVWPSIARETWSPGSADTVDLFFESRSHQLFNSGDNLTVAPNGHLIVCEDQYTAQVDNYLRGLTATGVP